MNKVGASVLCIGEHRSNFSLLFQWLDERGCNCRFASSYDEGMRLFSEHSFDLILCSGQPGIRTLFPAIVGSSSSLFCGHAIEDSCLWVPVILQGVECLGKSPLRPKEFAETLRQMLNEIESAARDRRTAAGG